MIFLISLITEIYDLTSVELPDETAEGVGAFFAFVLVNYITVEVSHHLEGTCIQIYNHR